MALSNANTSGLEVVAWRWPSAFCSGAKACSTKKPKALSRDVELEPLVTAASAQERIAELEAENDVLKVEVIGLRAAIFGSHDYDPSLRHGNFVEMARATEDGRQGALARATAAEARADRLAKALERIERWFGEFPETGKFWPNTDGSESDRPMSYGACWGSNGERDYMRSIARAALETQP